MSGKDVCLAETIPKDKAREQHILDTALELFTRHGYDKTTMSDIAAAAGIGRGVLYLHFSGKDDVFEALLMREMASYGETWLRHIEANPQGGTLGGLYRSVLYALNQSPFMSMVIKRDPQLVGQYLRKPGNLLVSLSSAGIRSEFVRAMQEAGVVRKDIDPDMIAYVMDILSVGLVTVSDLRPNADRPPFDALMETIAGMVDRMLLPAEGANYEGGKEVIRRLAAQTRAQFEQMISKDQDT